MSIFNNIFGVNKIDSEFADNIGVRFNGNTYDATVDDPTLKFNRPRFIKQIVYKPIKNIVFMDAEFDMASLQAAVQLDGILNRAVNLFTEQITKNGFELCIPDDKLTKHIANRLREIELFTNKTNTELMTNIARQLVTYGNAFIVKIRKGATSKLAKPYKLFGSTKQPIVGLFIVEASTMKYGLDIDNSIQWYKQVINGQEKLYDVDDVIHLFYNKVPGLLSGRSSLIPILDDVRALRKLEEEAEILGFQYAVPLYLYKVGTDTHPAAPGEVDSVAMEINHMNTYGIMCVPHTHTVETVTSNNDVIDIMKYIEHFKARVYTGLGVSPVAMGELSTSNRNSSEAAYVGMQAITISYQQIISEKFEMELMKELALDGGFDPQKFEYHLKFNEIDLEATIKRETHIIQKYQSNLITRDEARIEMKMIDTKIVDKDLYMNQVQIPLIKVEATAKATAQIKIQENAASLVPPEADANHPETTTTVAKTNATATTGAKHVTTVTKKGPHALPGNMSSKALSKLKTAEKKVTGKSQPSNQHGKQLARPVFKKDEIEDLIVNVNNLSVNLLEHEEYKSTLNRDTFFKKTINAFESAILSIVDYDKEIANECTELYKIRIKDRVDRLETIDSEENYDYIIKSILDEIRSLYNYTENNDEE